MASADPSPPGGPPVVRRLQRAANHVVVALLGMMFVSFLLQIAFRYVLNRPLGWTEEVTVLCWVWVVLWGASFIVADEEEVRFDILYNAVPARVRRVFTIVAAVALIVLLALSLPATWRYVAFMKREHSAYLKMPFDYLYSIYLVFAVVIMLRQGRLIWLAWRGPHGGDPAPHTDLSA